MQYLENLNPSLMIGEYHQWYVHHSLLLYIFYSLSLFLQLAYIFSLVSEMVTLQCCSTAFSSVSLAQVFALQDQRTSKLKGTGI